MRSRPDSIRADQEYIYDSDSAMTTKYHGRRTASTHAYWFLPYLQSGMNLLDCGCGPGSITEGLAEAVKPGQVTAIDTSENVLEHAKERISKNKITNIRFEVGDVCRLDYSDNSFDALFSHNVLEHIPDAGTALQEMYRVLKPGGVIGIRNIDCDGSLFAGDDELWEKLFDFYVAKYENAKGHPRIGRQTGRLLCEAGFVDVKMSASYEIHSDFESRAIVAQALISEYRAANADELEAIKKALHTWQALPYALYAQAECEAIGWKPE